MAELKAKLNITLYIAGGFDGREDFNDAIYRRE